MIPGGYTGHWFANVGLAGVAGGVQTTGVANTTVNNFIPLSGGAGGAGQLASTNFAGGAVTGSLAGNNRIPSITGGALVGGAGGHGITLMNPFMSCGGAGGGSNYASGTGGAGGNGGWGSGGGGGGSGATAGAGGRGGDGFVLIVSW